MASRASATGITGSMARGFSNRPFDEVLAAGEPDFPFCLSWANETWSRRWHGVGIPDEVLQEQTYSEADDLAHAQWLIEVFADPRYIRVDDRPVFLVYRPFDLPAARRTTDTIREECVRNGATGAVSHRHQRAQSDEGHATSRLRREPQLRTATLRRAGPDRARTEDLRLHHRHREHAETGAGLSVPPLRDGELG